MSNNEQEKLLEEMYEYLQEDCDCANMCGDCQEKLDKWLEANQ